MDADTLGLLRATLVRAYGSASGPALLAALDELGWDEVGREDPAAVPLLFEVQGATLGVSAVLDRYLLDAAGLAGVAAGVGYSAHGAATVGGIVDGRLVARSLHLSGWLQAGRLALPVPGEDGTVLAVTPARAATFVPVAGLDPSLGLARADIDADLAGVELHPLPAARWDAAIALGRRCLAAELVALGRRMLDLAVEHAGSRRQFGRPIGSFQAVQHRLAEAHVSVVAARCALDEAWCGGDRLASAAAKALAGTAARRCQRDASQVLAGMGFTREFELHRLVRRALVLDVLLGSARDLTAGIGAELLSSRSVPRVGAI